MNKEISALPTLPYITWVLIQDPKLTRIEKLNRTAKLTGIAKLNGDYKTKADPQKIVSLLTYRTSDMSI